MSFFNIPAKMYVEMFMKMSITHVSMRKDGTLVTTGATDSGKQVKR